MGLLASGLSREPRVNPLAGERALTRADTCATNWITIALLIMRLRALVLFVSTMKIKMEKKMKRAAIANRGAFRFFSEARKQLSLRLLCGLPRLKHVNSANFKREQLGR